MCSASCAPLNHSQSADFRAARTAAGQPQPLEIYLEAADGTPLGGLVCHTVWGWLYLDNVWLAEAVRGQGWGRQLVTHAEAEARRRGCSRDHLRTYDFQAREFYRARSAIGSWASWITTRPATPFSGWRKIPCRDGPRKSLLRKALTSRHLCVGRRNVPKSLVPGTRLPQQALRIAVGIRPPPRATILRIGSCGFSPVGALSLAVAARTPAQRNAWSAGMLEGVPALRRPALPEVGSGTRSLGFRLPHFRIPISQGLAGGVAAGAEGVATWLGGWGSQRG